MLQHLMHTVVFFYFYSEQLKEFGFEGRVTVTRVSQSQGFCAPTHRTYPGCLCKLGVVIHDVRPQHLFVLFFVFLFSFNLP